MDEAAALAGTDPLEYRLRHLDDPRAVAVLERVGRHGRLGRAAAAGGLRPGRRLRPLQEQRRLGRRGGRGGGARAGLLPPALDRRRCGRGGESRWRAEPVRGRRHPRHLGGAAGTGALRPPQRHQRRIGRATRSCASPRSPGSQVDLIARPDQPFLGAGEASMAPTIAAIAGGIHRCARRPAARACPSRPRTLAKSRSMITLTLSLAWPPPTAPGRCWMAASPCLASTCCPCPASRRTSSAGRCATAPSRSPNSRWAATSSPRRAATAPMSASRSSSPAPSAIPPSISAPTAASAPRPTSPGAPSACRNTSRPRRSGCAASCASIMASIRAASPGAPAASAWRSPCRTASTCSRSAATCRRPWPSGEIDALIAPRPPACLRMAARRSRRLYPDYRAEEIAWHRASGFFPIMHCLAVRKDVAAAPSLAAAGTLPRLQQGQGAVPGGAATGQCAARLAALDRRGL